MSDQMPKEALVTAHHFKDFFRANRQLLLGRGLMGFSEETWQKDDSTRTGVGETDLSMQKKFMDLLSQRFPEDIILGEEGKEITWPPKDPSKNVSVFDPLDGSSNRKGGLPTFGSMFARIKRGGQLDMAAIYLPREDHSFGDGFFFAQRDCGAWQWSNNLCFRRMTGRRMPAGRIEVLVEGKRQEVAKNPRTNNLERKIASRSSVSSSWAAVLVSLGRYDGLVAFDNAPWDNLPILVFAQELGLVVTDFDANPVTTNNCRSIVVAQQAAHAKIIEALKP